MDDTKKRLPSPRPANKHAPIASNRPSNKFQQQSRFTKTFECAAFVKSVQINLNNNLGNLLPIMYEEMKFALDHELGNSNEWHPISPFPTFLRIIALVSGRINIGLPLSRDPTWLTLYTKYPLTIMYSISSLMKYPAILRPLAKHFISLRELDVIRDEITTLLTPEYEAIISGKSNRNENMVQWIWDNSEEHERTISHQSQVQAMMSIGTVLANAAAAAQCLVDVAEHSEMIPLLRGEFERFDSGGYGITKQAISSLSTMDSFIKELQRSKPPGAGEFFPPAACFLFSIFDPNENNGTVTFERKVIEPFSLLDGTRLHAGEHIAAPAFHVGWDPEYIENPEVFDGLRFHRLRNYQGGLSASTTATGKYHYVSVNETSLHFGYGRNACPGRWFTAIQIKLFLGFLLVRYDVASGESLKGDGSGKGGEGEDTV